MAGCVVAFVVVIVVHTDEWQGCRLKENVHLFGTFMNMVSEQKVANNNSKLIDENSKKII